MRPVESINVGVSCKTVPVEDLKQQPNENDCPREADAKSENDIINSGTAVVGLSSIGTESTEVGIHSGEIVIETGTYTDATQQMDSKTILGYEVCIETNKTAEQQTDVDSHPIRAGARTETIAVQYKNLVELQVSDAEVGKNKSLNLSDRICCQSDIGTRSEIGHRDDEHAEESEVGTDMEMFKPVKQQSNGSCYANEAEERLEESISMQVGEVETSTLQDQFSKLSCKDPTPLLGDSQTKMVSSNIESLCMSNETQLSLDQQLQKAC